MPKPSETRTTTREKRLPGPIPHPPQGLTWPQHLHWRQSAPDDLRTACAAGEIATIADQLRRLWKLRKKQQPLARQLLALSGGLPVEAALDVSPPAAGAADSTLPPRETSAATNLPGRNGGRMHPDQIAANFLALRLCSRSLGDRRLVELAGETLAAADDSLSNTVQKPDTWQRLIHLAEGPVLHAFTFAELKGSRKRRKAGLQQFRQWLASELDASGNVRARWLPALPEVLKSFARATLFARLAGEDLWDAQDKERLAQFIRSLLSLGSPGRLAFSSHPRESLQAVSNAVKALGVLEKKDPLAAQFADWARADTQKRSSSRPQKTGRSWSLPEESWQSDDAAWATLRTGWNSPADVANVRFDLSVPQIDVILRDRPFLVGDWSVQWRIGEQTVPLADAWKCECWFSDADVDYLELTQQLKKPARLLVRQIILAKQESCLLLTDSIRCPGETNIRYEASLPVPQGFTWEQDSMTREAALSNEGLRARVFPLALPQAKVHRGNGSLQFQDGRLILGHSAPADGLFVPIVVEWDPGRSLLSADWNQLTVAQAGRKLSPAEAVGYRLRVGKHQWLLYHQLSASKIPRSVLGVHTLNETLLARVDSRGDARELLLVEASE